MAIVVVDVVVVVVAVAVWALDGRQLAAETPLPLGAVGPLPLRKPIEGQEGLSW